MRREGKREGTLLREKEEKEKHRMSYSDIPSGEEKKGELQHPVVSRKNFAEKREAS